ncbi:CHAT domain-containing protein [Propionibacteriaceae bacterium Y1923]
MHQTAHALYDQARAALAEHRTDEADALLERAGRACPPGELELGLRIRISSAWVVFEREGLAGAVAVAARARAAAEQAGLPELVANASVQEGILHARAGDLAHAWRALSGVEATALAEPDRMRMLMNRGTIASELQRLDEAAADLAGAAALAVDLGVAPLQFMARHNLGWVQFLRGDLPAALREMLAADEVDVDLDRSVARLDRARVLLEAGLVVEAEELLLLARTGAPGAQQAAEIDVDLARCALLLGRPGPAARRAAAAARVFTGRAEPAWARRAQLVKLQASPSAGAARRLWQAARAAGDRGVAAQAAAVGMAVAVHPGAGRWDDLTGDLAWLTRSQTVSRRLSGLVALARREADSGRAQAARRLLARASRTLTRAQWSLASLDLRAAAALHAEAAAALDLDLAADLGPAALVETLERWRAAIAPVPQVGRSPDPRVAAAATALRRLRTEHPPTGPLTPSERRRITSAERELQALTWGTAGELPPPAVTRSTTHLAARARRAGVVLVVTVRMGDELSAVLLGDGPVRQVSLGAASAAIAAVEQVHADLTAAARLGPAHPVAGAVRASLAARLADLSRRLVEPWEGTPHPGSTTGSRPRGVVIVPTRALSGVPWPALPALARVPVTVAPTASSWAGGARVVHAPTVGVLTGPELPCAAAEAAAVAGHWPGSTAPRPGLVQAFATHDLLHVIAHGEHRGDNPLFSNLHLDEGVVVAHELEGVDLRASHVVLSACEVGRATHRPGDQPLGLTSMLLSSGVTCVVAPVAPVNDRLAARVMADYHRELATGLEAAEALARAVGDDPQAGAFVCFGAPWRVGLGN